MVTRILALPLVALLLVACGDGTGPGNSIVVTVQVAEIEPPEYLEGPLGDVEMRCRVTLRASARGRGEATWEDAEFRYFAGTDRSEPIGSEIVDAEAIQDSWNGATVAPGDVATAAWIFTSTATFDVEVVFRYRTAEGRERETEVSFSCGELPGVGPSVTTVELSNMTGDLEPGDSFHVTYGASGEAGIVSSIVTFSGPCEMRSWFSEPRTPSITRTVPITVPSGCALGVPLVVIVEVVDGALQRASRTVAPGTRLVDVTPPTLATAYFVAGMSVPLTGDTWHLFDQEVVTVRADASDNGDLAMLAWEADPVGVADSVPLSGVTSTRLFTLRVDQAWQGSQLRMRARDAGESWSNTVTAPAGEITIVPMTNASIRSAQVDGDVVKMAIDERRGVVYLAQSDRIAVFSLATMTVERVIPLASRPNDLDLLPGGDSLLVTLQPARAVALIDLTTPEPAITEIPLTLLDPGQGHVPVHVRVAANRKAFISYVGFGGGDRLLEVDLVTGVQRIRPDLPGVLGTVELERSHDASTVMFENGRLNRYDAASDTWSVGGTTSSDARLSIDADGSTILHDHKVYDATLSPIGTIDSFGADAAGSVISPDGSHAWFDVAQRGVLRASISTGALLDRVSTDTAPFGQYSSFKRFTSDGSTVVRVERRASTSRVSVIVP